MGISDLPAGLSLHELRGLKLGVQEQLSEKIVALGEGLDAEGMDSGTPRMRSFSVALLADVLLADLTTQFSQVIVTSTGDVAGFLLAYYEPALEHVRVLKLGVSPAFRGKGLATRMLSAVARRAQKLGISQISVHVFEENKAVIALYEDLGFRFEARRPSVREPYFVCEYGATTWNLLTKSRGRLQNRFPIPSSSLE